MKALKERTGKFLMYDAELTQFLLTPYHDYVFVFPFLGSVFDCS